MLTPHRRLILRGSAMAAAFGLLLYVLLWRPELPSLLEGLALLDPRVREQLARREQYDRISRALESRRSAKEAVARDLACGRLTLLDAAARVRDIDRACPYFPWEEFRRASPHASDEERHCREMIGQVRSMPPLGDPANEDAALGCEAELREHIARGTLHLPEAAVPPCIHSR
jgi:hypothetical protein